MSNGNYEPHVVMQGEYLTQLAVRHGFDAETVWSHPSNKPLRDTGRLPNILAPNDVLYFPRAARKWLPAMAGQVNAFTATVVTVPMVLTFGSEHEAWAGAAYIVGGLPGLKSGALDGSGILKISVPTHVREFFITFPGHKRTFTIRPGHLDPVRTRSGIVQRLTTLGFLTPHPWADNDPEDELRLALCRFQKTSGLTVTGQADKATQNALVSAHQS